MKFLLTAVACLFSLTGLSAAQTTGTVFGPEVDPEGREFEYRIAAEFEQSGDDASLSHRLHYQQALTWVTLWNGRRECCSVCLTARRIRISCCA